MSSKIVMLQETSLTSSVSATATEIYVEFLKDIAGNYISTMTPFGDLGVISLSPNTTREEVITFTGVTSLTGNKVKLTGVTKGIAPVTPYDSQSQ